MSGNLTQAPAATSAGDARQATFVLSFDLEDWHQLVGRHAGLADWDRRHDAFEREGRIVLELLDELGVKATFFVLGMCARNYPEIVRELAKRGHEVACHGYDHARVYAQTRDEFRHDVELSVELIEELCGRRPIGYRAPAFSINRDRLWAYDVLAELGFRYDSSQYDSPRVPRRIRGIPGQPYPMTLSSGRQLWEFPVAVWQLRGRPIPIGGGGYWRFLPNPLLLRALRDVGRSGTYPALYFHPYECDPLPLRAELPPSRSAGQHLRAKGRSLYRNPGRRRVPDQIRRVSQEFALVPHEAVLDQLARGDARPRTLSPQGVLV